MKITVEEQQDVLHQEGETILQSLERAQVPVHFHCREGFCGACRTKLLAGDVDYTLDPLAYIDDDEFLPCCCVPLGDIKIKCL